MCTVQKLQKLSIGILSSRLAKSCRHLLLSGVLQLQITKGLNRVLYVFTKMIEHILRSVHSVLHFSLKRSHLFLYRILFEPYNGAWMGDKSCASQNSLSIESPIELCIQNTSATQDFRMDTSSLT